MTQIFTLICVHLKVFIKCSASTYVARSPGFANLLYISQEGRCEHPRREAADAINQLLHVDSIQYN